MSSKKVCKKLLEKDKRLSNWLKKGGREGAKKDFSTLLKLASQPLKPLH